MIRLFAALSLPQDIATSLMARQTGIEGARWRPLEALHLTLRFFGEGGGDGARDLDAELTALSRRPFEITLAGAGCFSDSEGPEAIWGGVAERQPLTRLAEPCEPAARRTGLSPDKRRYRPHVTLAYLRRADPAEVAA